MKRKIFIAEDNTEDWAVLYGALANLGYAPNPETEQEMILNRKSIRINLGRRAESLDYLMDKTRDADLFILDWQLDDEKITGLDFYQKLYLHAPALVCTTSWWNPDERAPIVYQLQRAGLERIPVIAKPRSLEDVGAIRILGETIANLLNLDF